MDRLGKGKLDIFFHQHALAAVESFKRLVLAPASTFMTIAVLAVALALPAGLYCALGNLTRLCDNWHPSNQISVYLKENAHQKILLTKIRALPGVAEATYISSQRGLREFERALGVSNVLAGLKSNPIPAVIQVHPKPLTTDTEQLEALKIQLAQMEGVENAKLDTEWVQRLNHILDLANRTLLALSAIFSIAVILVVSNTIRLNIQNQRQAIEIMDLIGATNAYIRRPFLYHGLIYGAVSGLFAWTWVNLLILWLRPPVQHLSTLYHSQFRLNGFNLYEGLTLIVLSGILGLVAAALVVKSHLNEISYDTF